MGCGPGRQPSARYPPDGGGGWEILRVDGSTLTTIYTCNEQETCFPDRFHKDGTRVYIQTNKGEGDLVRLELMDVETGTTELVESDPENQVDFDGAIFSNATEELIGTSTSATARATTRRTTPSRATSSAFGKRFPKETTAFAR